ncbi:MAG: PQ-loop domain-containing transporter [Patescibacteria group bacterium]
MNREKVAKKIHWAKIIWIVSIVNPLMTLPQLIQIWQTHETAGLSFGFLGILFFVQGGFSLHGFFTRDRFIMGSNGLAATMTLFTILSTLYFRNIAG